MAMEELKVFWIVATFLALMFAAFTVYRRLILQGSASAMATTERGSFRQPQPPANRLANLHGFDTLRCQSGREPAGGDVVPGVGVLFERAGVPENTPSTIISACRSLLPHRGEDARLQVDRAHHRAGEGAAPE
jgi:hypothetical protein